MLTGSTHKQNKKLFSAQQETEFLLFDVFQVAHMSLLRFKWIRLSLSDNVYHNKY